MLFHGNSYLIEGFNTFPPGYHVHAIADPYDPSLIIVTTPLGTMTSKIMPGNQSTGAGGPSFGSPLPFASPTAGSVNPPPEAASSASRSASLLSQAGQGQPYRPPLPAGALRQPQNGDLYPPPIHPRPMPNGQVNIVGVSGRPQAGSSASGASPVPTTLPSPAPHPAPSVTSPPPTPLTTNRSTSLSTIGPERHIPANLPANLAAEICGVRQEHIPTPPLKILPDKINCTQHCLPGSKHETFPPN